MTEITFSRLCGNLKAYCDLATADREPVRVRRRNGKDVVLVSADEYDSMAETQHLLASPANAMRLFEAMDRARRGVGKPMSLKKFRASLGL